MCCICNVKIYCIFVSVSLNVSVKPTRVSGFQEKHNPNNETSLEINTGLFLREEHAAWIEAGKSKAASGWPSLTHTVVPVSAAFKLPEAGKEEIRSF